MLRLPARQPVSLYDFTIALRIGDTMTDHELLPWVRAVLTTTPARWLTLAGSLPDELLQRGPAAGEWSAAACLRHLVETERLVFPLRVHYVLAGQDFPPFSPRQEDDQAQPEQSLVELAQYFAELRQEAVAKLEQVTAADLGRQARHPDFGPVTLGQLLHTWAAHDLMHTVQAERALMQPFIASCGPWRRYFADHWAG
jgi:uncharacterized damage-inducible protein DinB